MTKLNRILFILTIVVASIAMSGNVLNTNLINGIFALMGAIAGAYLLPCLFYYGWVWLFSKKKINYLPMHIIALVVSVMALLGNQ